MSEKHIRETMEETLADEPDAAFIVTIQDFDELDTSISLYSENTDDDELARRLLAQRGAAMLAKYFPNEVKNGAAKVAGGQVHYQGTFTDPQIEWEKKNEEHDNE